MISIHLGFIILIPWFDYERVDSRNLSRYTLLSINFISGATNGSGDPHHTSPADRYINNADYGVNVPVIAWIGASGLLLSCLSEATTHQNSAEAWIPLWGIPIIMTQCHVWHWNLWKASTPAASQTTLRAACVCFLAFSCSLAVAGRFEPVSHGGHFSWQFSHGGILPSPPPPLRTGYGRYYPEGPPYGKHALCSEARKIRKSCDSTDLKSMTSLIQNWRIDLFTISRWKDCHRYTLSVPIGG